MKSSDEFKKFDDAVRSILTVSKPELKKRQSKWKQQKAKKKRDLSEPASPALADGQPASR